MSHLLVEPSYWSIVLNFLAQQYFVDSHATCVLWHSAFDLQLAGDGLLPVINMDSQTWANDEADVYDYESKRREFERNGIAYNDWILRLTVAIEHSHCETFLAFQEQIPDFACYFYNASIYSIWRSPRNRFIFAYTEELLLQHEDKDLLQGYIFHDQPNVWLVSAPYLNSSIFDIKTNRFVGPRDFNHKPGTIQLNLLQRYDAQLREIIWERSQSNKMSKKLQNLQGREVVIGIFDYKPFMLLDYERQPTVSDRAEGKTEVFIDGTEVRLMMIFCKLYNCTVQVDTTEPSDWGDIYSNATGYGLVGMVLDRRNDYGIGGMYLWYEAYQHMDMTHFLGRSGVTCLVPAPKRLISWTLLLRPFHAILWLCVMVCLLLEILGLCLTRRWEQSMLPQTWIECLRFGCVSTLKLFVNQSTSYVTTSNSLRTVLLASYMIDIILTTVYSGGLAAILTLPTLEEAADSRQRLYDHKLIWTGTSQAWITTIDERSADPVLLGLMEHYRVFDAALITAYSRSEQMGFVVERLQYGHLGNTELISNDSFERLKLMVDDIYFAFTVAFVPRLWPHLNAYNDFIMAWHSSGLDKFWEWKIAAEYMNAHRQNRIVASQKQNLEIGPVQLGFDNIIGLIMLWCFGLICSLLAFVGEIWHHKQF